jgi:hypothetical protein
MIFNPLHSGGGGGALGGNGGKAGTVIFPDPSYDFGGRGGSKVLFNLIDRMMMGKFSFIHQFFILVATSPFLNVTHYSIRWRRRCM